ncbi:restriction endonuclease subunit S [Pseudohalioglobus lutimaris]|uniref:Type I restriction modification DNA specificity domain-containing protein n=1 Tax=Pseudohalioglobus lutimaris TaxID=1737061 RepID=A0A2N5X100_9GAMM|nr:restriction endonuclease subunit S [Pseudohalioglobus lutimaris]PLW68161.1 hypothetical protein C0039_13275 [Pseudohalioglobus lutimaris]
MTEQRLPLQWERFIANECFAQISTTHKKVKTKDCQPEGRYPVIDQGQEPIAGYVDDEEKVIPVDRPLCIFGDHTRAIKWVDHDFVPGADGTKVLSPKEFLDPRFAYYQLRATSLPDKGYSRHFKYLKEAPFLVPPLEEQTRIANKLDELLAQVDTIKARVDAIPDILKRFRQSVLAAAVSGELVDCANSISSEISDICKVIGGLTKNAKRKEFPNKLPYLRVANVYEDELRLEDVVEIGVQEKELARLLLQADDLLVVEGNGSLDQIGRVALWDGSISPCVHQNHLIKVRADSEKVIPKYLLYYLMSPQGKKEIVAKATSGAGLYTLSISKISSVCVPLFPIKDQIAIVERVDTLFSYAGQIQMVVESAQSRINTITQSILSKAFRGELVAQDTDDESASTLLERIRSGR